MTGRREAWGRRLEFALFGAFWALTVLYVLFAKVFAAVRLAPGPLLRLLAAGGWSVLENARIPHGLLAAWIAALAALLAGGLWGLRARRWRLSARPAAVVAACYVAASLVVAEQYASISEKSPRSWLLEQSFSPLYVPVFRPHGLARYWVQVRPFPRTDLQAASLPPAPKAGRPDANVFLIVLESFRGDFVTKENTPNLFALRGESLGASRAFSNGNATLLSWFALFNSEQPLYVDTVRRLRDYAGAPAMTILRRSGFDLSAFASSDISYFNYRDIIFGPGGRLASVRERDPSLDPAENDRRAVRRLLEAVRDRTEGGRHFYALFLDSAHACYYWPKDYPPRFQPYLPIGLCDRLIHPDAQTLLRVSNRYRNALSYVDSLVGQLVADLQRRGLYDDAVLIVAGDHGQAFGEHDDLGHSSSLYDEQVTPPLFFKLPGIAAAAREGPISQLDVMPTLLDYLGLTPPPPVRGRGRSLLQAEGVPILISAVNGIDEPEAFSLVHGGYKTFFFLDPGPTPGLRGLTVWDVSDLDDRPVRPGRSLPSDYAAFLDKEFVPFLSDTGAMEIVFK